MARVQNDAFVNEEVDPSLVIRRLKAEVKALKQELAFLKGQKARASPSCQSDPEPPLLW